MSRTAALGGASGFLGARLAERMIARGWRVRALIRRPADGEALHRIGAETVPGDLADAASLATLTEGAAVSVNCAGLIKARNAADFLAANRDGAARFASAATGRVIHVSSLAARSPELSDYAASKCAGEAAAREAAGARLTVVRPPVIYGPGDRETLALFRMAAGSPLALTPARTAARLALAHVNDVADAIADLMERPELAGVYAIGGDRPDGYGWGEIIDAAFSAVGRRAPPVRVPAWTIGLAAIAFQTTAALTGQAAMFTRGKAREMLHDDWSVAPDEIAPGAPPARFPLEAGFADAVRWYRRAGWL